MSYRLYYAPGSAAMGIRVLLEEFGAEYELVDTPIAMDAPRSPDHLALNPNGWVPVLIWNEDGVDHAMYECAAITIFLCDRHAEYGLAPAVDDSARGRFLQTLVYFSNTLQTAFQQFYYPDRFADTPEDEAGVRQRAIRRLQDTWQVVDDQIGDGDWVLGDPFSAADIYLFMLTTWADTERGQPDPFSFSNVKRVAEKVMARASVRRVYGDWIGKSA